MEPSNPGTFDPVSDEIEAIYQATFGAGSRVVAVIGVSSGDGASSCAAALAIRSMLGRRSTLLVANSDSERPHFCRAGNSGAGRCLAAGKDAPNLCRVCVAPVITSEKVDAKNSLTAPLAWKRFGVHNDDGDVSMLLREPAYLRSRWAENHEDWSSLVVDCEPALADGSQFPGRLVAQSADAVVLVARGGEATAESLAQAKLALGAAKIVGIVVNARDQRKVGDEIALRLRRRLRWFPRLSEFLATRAERMRLLDVVA